MSLRYFFKTTITGDVHKFANQYIGTRFYMLLIPIKSQFVILDKGIFIDIPIFAASLKNYFYSTLSAFLGIVLFIFSIAFGLKYYVNSWILTCTLYLSYFLIAYSFYILFFWGRSNKYEKKRRVIYQEVLGMNALPEWLYRETVEHYFNQIDSDDEIVMIEKINNQSFTSNEFFIFYTYWSYKNVLQPTAENNDIYNKLNKRLL